MIKVFSSIILMMGALLSNPVLAEDKLDPDWYGAYRGHQLVKFAKMFEGIRYDYANSDPMRGFDCSGFVNYIYGYFNVKVPRISAQFDNIGKTISLTSVRAGDILLFKGSNVNSKETGHLGIVTEVKGGKIFFLHSATSNNRGIMTSNIDETYFKARFIKAIRVL